MWENFDFPKKSYPCVLPWALPARAVEIHMKNKMWSKTFWVIDKFIWASTKKHQQGGHLWQGKSWESVVIAGTDFSLCNNIQRGGEKKKKIKKNLSLTGYFWNPNFLTAAAVAAVADGSDLDEIIFFKRDQEFSWSVVCLQDMGLAVPVLSVQDLSREGWENKSYFI